MSSTTYDDFRREPAKPHQCVYVSEQDGTRCHATAMHNQIMCYHHRDDDLPAVIENDCFLLENLDTRADIQRALGQVAARLACNHIDFERAKLLLKTINYAIQNLPPHPRSSRTAPQPTTELGCPTPDNVDRGVSPSPQPVILSEQHRDESKHPDESNPTTELGCPTFDTVDRGVSLSPTPQPVILSEQHRDESKHPDESNPASTTRTFPPSNPPAEDEGQTPPSERDYTAEEQDSPAPTKCAATMSLRG